MVRGVSRMVLIAGVAGHNAETESDRAVGKKASESLQPQMHRAASKTKGNLSQLNLGLDDAQCNSNQTARNTAADPHFGGSARGCGSNVPRRLGERLHDLRYCGGSGCRALLRDVARRRAAG